MEGASKSLKRYVSPLTAWALSFGCAVGWGAFMMPGTVFLPIAGPLGTALGMFIGGFVMFLIGASFHYMIKEYPDCGGTFTYAKMEIGFDHGFLSAWFLALAYMAIVWANTSAIPLFLRNVFLGEAETGPHYVVAGFDVYISEAVVAVCVLGVAGCICAVGGRLASAVQTLLALILIVGVFIASYFIFIKKGISFFTVSPHFTPSDTPKGLQVFFIVALAPWAYIGFESVSHSAEEFIFPAKRIIIILTLSLVSGVLAYGLLSFIAASAIPEGCTDWADYISRLDSFEGLEGLPTFYAIHKYMGDAGITLLGFATAAGILTGLIGNTIAFSRLVYAMGRDGLLPVWFSRLSPSGVPVNAVLFLIACSLPMPFLGRTAIGWIVDVNTIGAAIAYAYTSYVANRLARRKHNKSMVLVSGAGLVISIIFLLYFLVPNFWSVSVLAPESYLILIVWCIAGFLLFHYMFRRDTKQRMGRSVLVWLVLLFLVFFLTMLWVREASRVASEGVLQELNEYNRAELLAHGVEPSEKEMIDAEHFLDEKINEINSSMKKNSLIQMVIIFIALAIMFRIYYAMQKREKDMEVEKIRAEESNKAKSVFLSNMSHDIRTPMNAIIGYTEIAKQSKGMSEETSEYLEKIESSSRHLLGLINDVLDMSRIESGKMELEIAGADIVKALNEVYDIFITQMRLKDISYTVDTKDVTHSYVLCDVNRLNRVLLNLVSNAYKFTPSGGKVSVVLAEEESDGDKASYRLRVKDSGMGMSPEFAAKVFDAYERERTVSNIQGTGLGMSITKSLVDLMGGSISVESEQGKGTEFTILLSFTPAEAPIEAVEDEKGVGNADFSGFKLLLVEDQVVNREIATLILTQYGFELDYAENGKEAVDKVSAALPGQYDLVLMDIQMPIMNGYDSAKAIRALEDEEKCNIPILAMTANAFAEDIAAAKEAGMNGHIAKPIEINSLIATIKEVLPNH